MRRRKKQQPEEHENLERWLVSWADMMTLLFAVFVMLYAISQVDRGKLATAAHAFRIALNNQATGGFAGGPDELLGPPCIGDCVLYQGEPDMRLAERFRRRLEDQLRPYLREQEPPPVAITSLEGKRLVVRLASSEFFDTGAAALRPEALPILDAIGIELAKLQRNIRIEGHTDDRPIRNAQFRNNWDLSAARAATVVAYLEQAHRIPGNRLAAVGYGATRPIASNANPEGREANRRIEIVVETEPGEILDEVAR